tara:strand:- start:2360 stop:2809 length:450 start_codon:yes stop_codon:yes gene_type:complete
MKHCKSCGTKKKNEEFYSHPATKDNLQIYCKECTISKYKTWTSNNPERYLVNSARGSAKKRDIYFDLKPSDIVIPDVCPVLGIPIGKRSTGKQGHKDDSATIDRFDNNKGYVKGNVFVISWKANKIKANGTYEEIMKVAEWMRKNNASI